MKRHKENLFAEKFHLLNSQESQDIIWSSSESSDFENISCNVDKQCNITNNKTRKRKRKPTVPKNISNLDVTIVDVQKDAKSSSRKFQDVVCGVKPKLENSPSKSPILGSTQYFSPFKCKDVLTSPIISCTSNGNQSKGVTSPILILKSASPNISPSVRKKLFTTDKIYPIKTEGSSRSNSIVLSDAYCLDRRKSNNKAITHHKEKENMKSLENNEEQLISECNYNKFYMIKQELLTQRSQINENLPQNDVIETQQSNCFINETPENTNINESIAMLRTSSVDLVRRVKSYFDCHFSSDNASQNTISEVATPKNNSKSSDDVEIISSMTQTVSTKNSTETVKEEINFESKKKEKKIRYKKDGLAYRLNSLVKKQTASISLWHHERFLVANSNFFIPKGEFLAFRIFKVHFKYGCHLLDAMDVHDDSFVIFINNCVLTTDIISTDTIIKIYEPYKILDTRNNCKYVFNVVKFECVNIKE